MAEINVEVTWTNTHENLRGNEERASFADKILDVLSGDDWDDDRIYGEVVGFLDRADGGTTARLTATVTASGYEAALERTLRALRGAGVARPDSIEIMTDVEADRRYESGE